MPRVSVAYLKCVPVFLKRGKSQNGEVPQPLLVCRHALGILLLVSSVVTTLLVKCCRQSPPVTLRCKKHRQYFKETFVGFGVFFCLLSFAVLNRLLIPAL